MKSGRPIVVVDPYDWLPGYGETGITVHSQGVDWVVEIEYDDPSQNGLWKRDLRFNSVCCFYRASFPGPRVLDIDYDPTADTKLGSLCEFPDSEAALAWREHFGKTRMVKHYGIWFMSENLSIQVFAEGFALSEPIPVPFP
jgi:hypothetical protein